MVGENSYYVVIRDIDGRRVSRLFDTREAFYEWAVDNASDDTEILDVTYSHNGCIEVLYNALMMAHLDWDDLIGYLA